MKIVHVHLHYSYRGKTDYYFGSITAIYDNIPQELIGIKCNSLTETMRGKDEYMNKYVHITRTEIVHKAQQAQKIKARK